MFPKLLLLLALTVLAHAAAIPSIAFPTPSFSQLLNREAGSSAASQLLIIAPTSNTCSGAAFPSECETAEQAAPFLISAMSQYGITSFPEIAALLSLIAFETGDFKYSTNHFPAPGRPGQGTRNMQMANYNLMYARSIPALAEQLAAIGTGDVNAVRALVLTDQYAWASAAWFLTTQCASARPAIQAGGQAGFEAYMSCVGTTATDDRLAYWKRANTAFGIA